MRSTYLEASASLARIDRLLREHAMALNKGRIRDALDAANALGTAGAVITPICVFESSIACAVTAAASLGAQQREDSEPAIPNPTPVEQGEIRDDWPISAFLRSGSWEPVHGGCGSNRRDYCEPRHVRRSRIDRCRAGSVRGTHRVRCGGCEPTSRRGLVGGSPRLARIHLADRGRRCRIRAIVDRATSRAARRSSRRARRGTSASVHVRLAALSRVYAARRRSSRGCSRRDRSCSRGVSALFSPPPLSGRAASTPSRCRSPSRRSAGFKRSSLRTRRQARG